MTGLKTQWISEDHPDHGDAVRIMSEIVDKYLAKKPIGHVLSVAGNIMAECALDAGIERERFLEYCTKIYDGRVQVRSLEKQRPS